MLKRVPLTLKMVLLTLIVGFAFWSLMDSIYSRQIENIFQAQLSESHWQNAGKEYNLLVKSIIQTERIQRAITGSVLILSFVVFMFWITKRVQGLTRRIVDFSVKHLGTEKKDIKYGDPLYILDEEFQQLKTEVIAASELIKQEAEERNRLIVNNSLDAIITIDENDAIITWNPMAESIFGYPRKEALGKKLSEIILPPQKRTIEGKIFKDLAIKMEEGEHLHNRPTEITAFRCDGYEFAVELLVSPVSIGETQIFICNIRDITERKRADKEKEDLIKELETKNTELEKFTYTVSHDLKSPLVTISGFSSILDLDILKGDTERAKRDTMHIRDAAGKMQTLLDDLLELSRVGRMFNPPEDVPLKEIVQEAISLVAGQIEQKGVRIEVLPDLPVIFADRRRLLEVFQNLIDNAVKFMDNEKEPLIEIGAWKDDEETLCYVRDNGMGIEPQYQEKIFELFERLDQRIEGTGIGLALIKKIIEVHGGTIWVESKGPGKGSSFNFTLPQKCV